MQHNKIIDINKFTKKKKLETLLGVDFLDLYKSRGKDFLINLFNYLITQLKEIGE